MTTFSKQQLYQVRNAININTLIHEVLQVERRFDKIWRFRCPLCGQFHTAVQVKNNLARCFDCRKNFNTIDLVIYCKKLNFAPSVRFLLQLLPRYSDRDNSEKSSHHTLSEQKNKALLSKDQAIAALDNLKQILR